MSCFEELDILSGGQELFIELEGTGVLCPRPTEKKFPLQGQVHVPEALQAVREATLRVLCASLVAMAPGRQGHVGESTGKGGQDGGRSERDHLSGEVCGAGTGDTGEEEGRPRPGSGLQVCGKERWTDSV
jgi:hypothetical protein